jgi:hypothetical protein
VPIHGSALRTALGSKLGFAKSGSGRGPHDKYRLYVDGQWVAQTQVPRGSSPIGDPLARRIAKQVGLTLDELRSMVSCDIDRETYLGIVLAQPTDE